jgi:hypothetical protein
MIRPRTSAVSALSGCVANGPQAIHFVSSAPSKIPYGGFSPVRLQTRLTPRPPSLASQRQLIGRHCSYLRPQRDTRNGTCVQSAPRTSDLNHESSGPWLPGRLCCPASRRGSPIYSASPFTPCRCPYSGGSDDCSRRSLRPRFCLRHFRIGSATTIPTNPEPVGSVTKLQLSLYATAWRCCSPCSGQGFYDRACVGRVTPKSHVGYDWMANRHLPSPVFHRLDWQHYGLRTRNTQGTHEGGTPVSRLCHAGAAGGGAGAI